MGGFHEYDQYDGLGLAELVRNKDVTPTELIHEATDRIEQLNPKINAVIQIIDAAGHSEMEKDAPPDRPFFGVPFLLKDVHHALKGIVMTSGSSSMRSYIPSRDAVIVARLKQAGVSIIGKTNTPEFKLGAVTEPAAFGPTRNPWNLAFSCGGSSGGSAAAVAAGIVPVASGTDEGGSIRIPAAYCGLFGLKPSRGRNPVGPDFDNALCGLSTSHVLSRSVRDSAAMLDALTGPEPGSPYGIQAPERPFLAGMSNDPGRLTIAFHIPSAYGQKSHADCEAAVLHTAKLLENLGHHVEAADPGYNEEEVVLTWCRIVIGHLGAYLDALLEKGVLLKIDDTIELQNRTMYAFGKRMKASYFLKAFHQCCQLGYHMAAFMQKYDLVLTPTLGQPPVTVGSQNPGRIDRFAMNFINSGFGKLLSMSDGITEILFKELARNAVKGQMPFTMMANLTGQPAMSLPLYWNASGLPCGVQFIGRYGDEATMLRLAAQLENAAPWFQKRPVLD